MPEIHIAPGASIVIDEVIGDDPVRVEWCPDVLRLFPTPQDRVPILEAIGAAMERFESSTFYYHLSTIGEHHVAWDLYPSEDGTFLEARCMMGEPFDISKEPGLLAFLEWLQGPFAENNNVDDLSPDEINAAYRDHLDRLAETIH